LRMWEMSSFGRVGGMPKEVQGVESGAVGILSVISLLSMLRGERETHLDEELMGVRPATTRTWGGVELLEEVIRGATNRLKVSALLRERVGNGRVKGRRERKERGRRERLTSSR
jgi:hypothetical protein